MLMEKLKKIEKLICMLLSVVMGIILAILVSINVTQVVTRYFVDVIVTWIEDVSILGIQWITALGVPLAWFYGSHLEMDITDHIYSERMKKFFWWLCQVICLIASVKLIQLGFYNMELNYGAKATGLGYDESLRYLPLVVCGVFLCLAAAFKILENIWPHLDRKSREGERE